MKKSELADVVRVLCIVTGVFFVAFVAFLLNVIERQDTINGKLDYIKSNMVLSCSQVEASDIEEIINKKLNYHMADLEESISDMLYYERSKIAKEVLLWKDAKVYCSKKFNQKTEYKFYNGCLNSYTQ